MNRLQLKEAAIPTTAPVSTSTTTSTKVQHTTVPLHTSDMLVKALCPIKELPDNNNKGNFNDFAECATDPSGMKWWKGRNQGT